MRVEPVKSFNKFQIGNTPIIGNETINPNDIQIILPPVNVERPIKTIAGAARWLALMIFIVCGGYSLIQKIILKFSKKLDDKNRKLVEIRMNTFLGIAIVFLVIMVIVAIVPWIVYDVIPNFR